MKIELSKDKELDIDSFVSWTLIIVIGLAMLLLSGCPLGKSATEKAIERASRTQGVLVSRERSQETTKGIRVYSKDGVDAGTLSRIDQGIDILSESAREDGFTYIPPHRSYNVYIPPYSCIASPVDRVPSFVLNGGAYYDGSEYDIWNKKGKLSQPFVDENGLRQVHVKDGSSVVYAAEYIVGQWDMYVCPDASIVVNAVRHGGDHIFLMNVPYDKAYRDREPYDGGDYFWCSVYHGGDRNHPLLPRNGRCPASLRSDGSFAFESKAVPKDIAEIAKEVGITVTASDSWRVGVIVRAVK